MNNNIAIFGKETLVMLSWFLKKIYKLIKFIITLLPRLLQYIPWLVYKKSSTITVADYSYVRYKNKQDATCWIILSNS